MLETIDRPDPHVCHFVSPVVAALLEQIDEIEAADLMLVGAYARDILHVALGHQHLPLRATDDVDIALALANWRAFDAIDQTFEATRGTGICYSIAGLPTDVLPFGDIERPAGKATPTSRRGEAIDVWGMAEVYEASMAVQLDEVTRIRIPTPAGLGVLKLAAWMDRYPNGEYKDADDLAVVLFWYRTSETVRDRLYDAERDGDILIQHDFDIPLAAAALLARDIADVLGEARTAQLSERVDAELRPNLLVDRLARAHQAYGLGNPRMPATSWGR